MRKILLAFLLLALFAQSGAAENDIVPPFEKEAGFLAHNVLDEHVLAMLEALKIRPSHLCSDEVFVRRVFLDLLGTLPEGDEVLAFLRDRAPDKRARLVDELLERDEHATFWALRWGDVLRIKAEFPINLWPNGVQAYHRWIKDQLEANVPYDRFARALLTSSGSNFREPAVNFYRAVQGRKPLDLAGAAALTFMGTRLEAWPPAKQQALSVFFSRVATKRTAEWKEEIVLLDPTPRGPIDAVLPDGTQVVIGRDEDPRRVFADWLIRPENPYFARAHANRVWAWLMGRGVVHESDDLRDGNPPANPALLDALAKHLVDAGWDVRSLIRLIVLSRTYQGSPIPRSDHPLAAALFAHHLVRPLEAEVLIDALGRLDDSGEQYVSIVPEPYTFVPPSQRTIDLADGTISSSFLELFGRPARDTGLASERSTDPTASQRLHMLNSSDVRRRIQRSSLFRRRGGQDLARRDPLAWVYLSLLSREPTPEERKALDAYAKEQRLQPRDVAIDLVWALLNSKEFLYRH